MGTDIARATQSTWYAHMPYGHQGLNRAHEPYRCHRRHADNRLHKYGIKAGFRLHIFTPAPELVHKIFG